MKKISVFLALITFSFFTCQAQIITTVIGDGIKGSNGNGGQATSAEIETPVRVIVDKAGNLYVSEPDYNVIRKVNKSGVISLFKGGFNYPTDLAIDDSGCIYVLDAANYEVKKINKTGAVTIVAGNGNDASIGDGGPATSASIGCGGISVDNFGNIYIAQSSQNSIRKINVNGIISTVAGNGTAGFSGDGALATSAELNAPVSITPDSKGNIYVADENNNRIRKIDKNGIITTIAGNGIGGYAGDGGLADSAELASPCNTTIGTDGNIYVADLMNSCIRVISSSTNIITTFAGNGIGGYAGDGGLADSAELDQPTSVAIDSLGTIYISDYANSVVRMVTRGVPTGTNNIFSTGIISVYPNPSNGIFKISNSYQLLAKSQIQVYNIIGEKVYVQPLRQAQGDNTIDLINQPAGVYLYRITSEKGEYISSGKLVIEK